jgi:hypothetical protein
MAEHDWLVEVFSDLEDYAKENALLGVLPHVAAASRAAADAVAAARGAASDVQVLTCLIPRRR